MPTRPTARSLLVVATVGLVGTASMSACSSSDPLATMGADPAARAEVDAVAGLGSTPPDPTATSPPARAEAPDQVPLPAPAEEPASDRSDDADQTPAEPTTTSALVQADWPTGADGQPLPTRPAWLGQRPLPTNADGLAEAQPTPPELADRRFATVDTIPPPPSDQFDWSVGPLTGDPLDRSTWTEECPVTLDELRYVRVTFWGFDQQPHWGELIINTTVVDEVVGVFRTLHQARFPMEEMRIVTQADLDAVPTGDGNNTTAFVCRPVVGGNRFSEHAYGLAVDINPFINPYQRGEVVLPELATAYLDRDPERPGVITEGGVVVEAFDAIGWGWGGRWQSLDDHHHFSLNNR